MDEEASVRSRRLEKHETDRRNSHEPQKVYRTFLEEEEEEEYDDEDGEEGEDVRAAKGKRGPPCVKLREGRWKRRCTRPHSLDLGALLSHTPAAPHTAQVIHNQRWLALTRLTVIVQIVVLKSSGKNIVSHSLVYILCCV